MQGFQCKKIQILFIFKIFEDYSMTQYVDRLLKLKD